MLRTTLPGMDLRRAADFRLLCYVIPTKASQFSVLTAPFPLALAVSEELLKLLWIDMPQHREEWGSWAGASWGQRVWNV